MLRWSRDNMGALGLSQRVLVSTGISCRTSLPEAAFVMKKCIQLYCKFRLGGANSGSLCNPLTSSCCGVSCRTFLPETQAIMTRGNVLSFENFVFSFVSDTRWGFVYSPFMKIQPTSCAAVEIYWGNFLADIVGCSDVINVFSLSK